MRILFKALRLAFTLDSDHEFYIPLAEKQQQPNKTA